MNAEISTLETEQALLGNIIFSADLYFRVEDRLAVDHFSCVEHQLLYSWITESILAHGKVIATQISRLMRESDEFDAVFDGYITKLMNAAPGAGTEDLADRIVADAKERRATELSKTISENPDQADDIIAEFLAEDMGRQGQATLVNMATLLEGFETARREALSRDGDIVGISTGLKDYDTQTGGLMPSEMSVWAGRPSMGKTAVALTIAENVAKQGRGVLFVSLEMSAVQLASRILSSNMRRRDIFAPYKGLLKWKSADQLLAETSGELSGLPMVVETGSSLTVDQISLTARKLNSKWVRAKRAPLSLLVVDYIGLVKPLNSYRGQRSNEIGEISKALKALSKAIDCHVMVLAQLNRGVENRDDKRPFMSDLRDSGEIEQDADVVTLLYRPHYYLRNDKKASEFDVKNVEHDLSLIIAKQRNGPTDTVEVFADMPHNLIKDKPKQGVF